MRDGAVRCMLSRESWWLPRCQDGNDNTSHIFCRPWVVAGVPWECSWCWVVEVYDGWYEHTDTTVVYLILGNRRDVSDGGGRNTVGEL